MYNLSILSSISPQTSSASGIPDASHSRLRPLYNIGVSDIPSLQEDARGRKDSATTEQGWVACTTDDVLSTKPELYDLLILMPPSESQQSLIRTFPKIVKSLPSLNKNFPRIGLKATQRDLDRYIHLQQGLGQFPPSRVVDLTKPSSDDDSASISSVSSTYSTHRTVVEPTSWSRVAYTSLVWWASAGDRRGGLAELEEMEAEHDLSLLQEDDNSNEDETREVAFVAYFHRMTSLIFQTIAQAIARADGLDGDEDRYHDEDDPSEDETPGDDASADQEFSGEQDESQALLQKGEEQSAVEISQEDMVTMGLDTWSASDKQFIEELTLLWWGRHADVRAATVECCGLRIL